MKYFNLTAEHSLQAIYIAYYLFRPLLTKEQLTLCQRIIELKEN